VSTQQMTALALANETRSTIAEFRREVRRVGAEEGARMVADVIERDHQDRIYGTARVGHLMRAIPMMGETKVYRLLLVAGIQSADRRLKGLTDRQREAVVAEVREWAVAWKVNNARARRYRHEGV
jgi:hypothetical protein